jgi:serine/threonine protein phosphatase PrpC
MDIAKLLFLFMFISPNALGSNFVKSFQFANSSSSIECGHGDFKKHGEDASLSDIYSLPDMLLVALIDGHGGCFASEQVQKHLGPAINKHFYALDKAFYEVNQKVCSLKKKSSGAVASVVIFNYVDAVIYMNVAHIGDISVVIGVLNNNIITPQRITQAHRPANEQELERIENFLSQKSPNNSYEDSISLTSSGSSMSEDMSFDVKKWAKKTNLQVTRSFGHKGLHSVGLTAKPEIAQIKLESHHRFLLLFSDGVGDYISDEEAIAIAWEGLNQALSLDEIAENILLKAARSDTNNIYKNHENLEELQRGISDDMSVIIILFNHVVRF